MGRAYKQVSIQYNCTKFYSFILLISCDNTDYRGRPLARPKNWMDIFKNEEEIRIWIFGEIFEIVNIYQKLTCNSKEKLGGAILKSLSFATGCADHAEIFFKSHVITKYKKSRLLSVCLLLK